MFGGKGKQNKGGKMKKKTHIKNSSKKEELKKSTPRYIANIKPEVGNSTYREYATK